jgi:hypothetical protein
VSAVIAGTLNGNRIENVPIAVSLVLTDATTKTYSQLTASTYTAPEDIPTGLAAQLLDERSTLHYEGALSFVSEEPDFDICTSNVCNVLPGGTAATFDDAQAWDDSAQWLDTIEGFAGLDSIRAVVESVRIVRTAANTTTHVSIGPPRHLQAQDFIAIARASRDRITSSWSRKDPAGTTSGSVRSGGSTPNQNGNLLGGGLPSADGKTENMAVYLKETTVGGETVLVADWDHLKWR